MLKIKDVEITWLGHDSFRISAGDKRIYIDPWKLANDDDATLILVTHEHFDHCSPEDVEKVSGQNTTIITTEDTAAKLEGNIKTVSPGDVVEVEGIRIEAVPAYNTDKKFHPEGNKWVGFIVQIGDTRIYHAGDTDTIKEMSSFKDITIALLPVSGTYVMTAEEAAEAAKLIEPEILVPMHFGDIVGSKADAERFKELCEGMRVEILKKEK